MSTVLARVLSCWSTLSIIELRIIRALATPITSRAMVTSVRTAAMSLTRSGTSAMKRTIRASDGQAEDVTHAAQRVDQARLGDVDLAPQIGDVGLDDAVVTAEVVVPHEVED